MSEPDYKALYELERAKVIQCTTAMRDAAEKLLDDTGNFDGIAGSLRRKQLSEMLQQARANPASEGNYRSAEEYAYLALECEELRETLEEAKQETSIRLEAQQQKLTRVRILLDALREVMG